MLNYRCNSLSGNSDPIFCVEVSLQVVFSLFDTEFIQGVSQFSVKGDKESKLRCK